jgi:hypothetical protein
MAFALPRLLRADQKRTIGLSCGTASISDWLEKMPKFDKIPKDRPDELPTLPLTPEQYTSLLNAIPKTFTGDKAKRVHALVHLMRHSGLAIRDAVTLGH